MIDESTKSVPASAGPLRAALAEKRASASRFSFGRGVVWLSLFLLLLPPLVFGDDAFRLSLFAKYLALAILALGVDLIWGYTGLLSLGQGLFFALGAYSLAYCLEMQEVANRAHAV